MSGPVVGLLSILVNKTHIALSSRRELIPELRRPERLGYPRNRCVDAGSVRVRLVHSEPGSVQAGDRGARNSPAEQPTAQAGGRVATDRAPTSGPTRNVRVGL